MNNKSKLFFAFGAGALLGAAAVALLTTDKGKALLAKAKEELGDLSEEVMKKVKDLEREFSELMRENTTDTTGHSEA